MEKINLTIDGRTLTVPANYTVLEAAREAGINIPTLCYLKDINEIGACRMCLVEVKGGRSLQASCVYPVSDGMEILTNSEKVRDARKANLELILSDHDKKCLTCARNMTCELQALAKDLNVTELRFEGENHVHAIDDLSPSIVRDNNKCILCKRCVAVCKNVQTTSVIGARERGFKTTIGSVFNRSLDDVACIMCGQCIAACPTAALKEKSHINQVFNALKNPDIHVVVQTAPAVRVALGEEFGMPIGTRVTGKMVASLKRLGFDKVFDTNTGADLTIMEESAELLHRINNNGTLPMITSCSPGWVKFCEHNFPEFIPNLSSCKSPHTMFGALIKSYYAEQQNIDPKNIFVVSVMPCTAKKYEIGRPEMEVDGLRDVDAVLTTRELANMIRSAKIRFTSLTDEQFDDPCGVASGAGAIFGATGGVMEAALRTAAYQLGEENLIEFKPVRGENAIKEFSVELKGITLKGAVVHGTGNARKLLEKVKSGEADYHFIEVMGCVGGCITGGGQPFVDAQTRMEVDVWKLRSSAIYDEDKDMPIRQSHKNPFMIELYKEDGFLGKTNEHKAHHLLHTTYTERKLYEDDLMDKPSI